MTTTPSPHSQGDYIARIDVPRQYPLPIRYSTRLSRPARSRLSG